MNVGIFRRCPAGKFDPKGECLGKILYETEVWRWLNTNYMLEVALLRPRMSRQSHIGNNLFNKYNICKKTVEFTT